MPPIPHQRLEPSPSTEQPSAAAVAAATAAAVAAATAAATVTPAVAAPVTAAASAAPVTAAAAAAATDVNQRLQNIANGAAPKLRSSTAVANDKPVVLVITDSNGRHLNPNLLHKDKKVVIVDEVFTLEQVVEKLPKIEKVSDIVMLVGINNIKRRNATIAGTVAHFDEVCKEVQKIYPNAKIHVGSVAPSCERFIFFNAELENLAQTRNVPFISALPILEVTPYGLRPKKNTLRDIHYTENGIKLFANEVKKSLHPRYPSVSPSRHSSGHQATMPPFIPSENQMPFAFRDEMRRFFTMALSALSPVTPLL